MGKPNVMSKISSRVPSALEKLLHRSDLATGENAEVYDAIITGVVAALDPQDTIEAFFIRDIVDGEWEIMRLQKIQAVLFSADSSNHEVISEIMSDRERARRVALVLSRAARAQAKANDKPLERSENSNQPVLAQAALKLLTTLATVPDDAAVELTRGYKKHAVEIERISRMIAVAQSRRNAALRELERYREASARRQRPSQPIVDAEFTDAPPD
jgi:hypothetical protein